MEWLEHGTAVSEYEGLSPDGPALWDSDGFIMNCLEEGALGDSVLAGNLVYNPDGRQRHN